jgi:hypothetical protein
MGYQGAAKYFGSELQYIEFLPYVFTLIVWKVAKTTAHQRLIFGVQKLKEALLYIFVNMFEFLS